MSDTSRNYCRPAALSIKKLPAKLKSQAGRCYHFWKRTVFAGKDGQLYDEMDKQFAGLSEEEATTPNLLGLINW